MHVATENMAESLDGSKLEAAQNQRRKCFYNNLLLLEFNESYMERKYKIAFNKDMFLVPNKKGFEVITHFLFTKLNEIIGKEEYKVFWPILNKEQAQEFRRTSHSYLNKISQNCTDFSFPQIVPSLFLSPGGERFYELYLALSTYILQRFVEKDRQTHVLLFPPLTSDNSVAVQSILELSSISLFREFAKCQRVSFNLHKMLQENAKNLVSRYRESKQILQDKKLLLQKYTDIVTSSHNVDNQDKATKDEILEVILQRSKLQLEKVQRNWEIIEELLSKEKDYWEIVRTELKDESSKKYVLDGKEYLLKMPESISQELIPELERMNIHSVYKDGKLCITSFINVLVICLEYYIKLLHRDSLPKVHNVKQLLGNVSETIDRNIGITKSISNKIASEISLEMMQGVSQLESSALLLHEEKIKEVHENNEKHPEMPLTNTPSMLSLPPSFSMGKEGACNTSWPFRNILNQSTVEESKMGTENELKTCAKEFLEEVPAPLKPNEKFPVFQSPEAFVKNISAHNSSDFLGNSFHKQETLADLDTSRGNSWIEEEICMATLPSVPLFD